MTSALSPYSPAYCFIRDPSCAVAGKLPALGVDCFSLFTQDACVARLRAAAFTLTLVPCQ